MLDLHVGAGDDLLEDRVGVHPDALDPAEELARLVADRRRRLELDRVAEGGARLLVAGAAIGLAALLEEVAGDGVALLGLDS